MTLTFCAPARWQVLSSFKGSDAEASRRLNDTASGTVSVDWVTLLSADKPILDLPRQQGSQRSSSEQTAQNQNDSFCIASLLQHFFLDAQSKTTTALTLKMCVSMWQCSAAFTEDVTTLMLLIWIKMIFIVSLTACYADLFNSNCGENRNDKISRATLY